MNRFKKVYELTLQLKELTNRETSPNEREKVIEELNELITERGECMDEMVPPLTAEEQELAAKVYSVNEEIREEMGKIFTDLKAEMRQVQKQKKTKEFYMNPYKDVQIFDGTFLDSKK